MKKLGKRNTVVSYNIETFRCNSCKCSCNCSCWWNWVKGSRSTGGFTNSTANVSMSKKK